MTIVQYKQNIFVVRQYIQCYEEFRQANDLILILAEGVWGEECGGRGFPEKYQKQILYKCCNYNQNPENCNKTTFFQKKNIFNLRVKLAEVTGKCFRTRLFWQLLLSAPNFPASTPARFTATSTGLNF